MTDADEKIQKCLEDGTSFLLDAGAGSGKTLSLVEGLNFIRRTYRSRFVRDSQKVACITFTNVAKDEIIDRTDHDPLFAVSTIHDFLWDSIKIFQKELKAAVIQLNMDLKNTSRRKKEPEELLGKLASIDRIIYSDRGSNFLEGRIFHDDLLEVANIMFRCHHLLPRLVAMRYPVIFVDEYQDTDPKVIGILLNCIVEAQPRPIIGLFGDKVQNIYQTGVGELDRELRGKLYLIQKAENYRCSKAVIRLLNKIRTDIEQFPAADNRDGMAVYMNLPEAGQVEDIAEYIQKAAVEHFGWEEDRSEPKALFLTHRLIARRAGYEALWRCYNDRGGYYRDRFQSGEDEDANFLCRKVETIALAWEAGKAGEAIAALEAQEGFIARADEKKRLHAALDELVHLRAERERTGDVLHHVHEAGLLAFTDTLERWLTAWKDEAMNGDPEKERERNFYAGLFDVPYPEVFAYRNILDNNLPYSTKHGVKGEEYETVFVILDDVGANWNQYSFGKYIAGTESNENRLVRTRNLFYVCCSRSKNRLVVVNVGEPPAFKDAILELFGAEYCVW